MTLWAAIVAERCGYERDEALTLGRAFAGVNAQSKGRTLGIVAAKAKAGAERRRRATRSGEALRIGLMGRNVPAVRTKEGLRALERERPSNPEGVERYLESKFGASLAAVRTAMKALAEAYSPDDLDRQGFALYEEFRPKIPAGVMGWGAVGVLDLAVIRRLAKPRSLHPRPPASR